THLSLPRGGPAAVSEHLLEEIVDPAAELVVLKCEADSVRLARERRTNDLELTRVLVGETREDHVVSGDGLDRAIAERLEAVRVSVGRRQRHAVLGDVLLRRRTGHRAHGLALEVFGARDAVRVTREYEQVLACDVIRASERDDFLAGVVD